MCGITGMFSLNGKPVDVSCLQKSIGVLNHRGPDCNRTWVSKRNTIGLAHARLSIIDLFTGEQPLSNTSENIHLVVNGEFYGYEKQRTALEMKGHKFRTQTDSEIAIYLYEEMGTACLSQLRGEFAFILWDEKKQICFAARDRFGIKPLFYSIFEGTLYLASEIKALLAAGIPSIWDEESMRLFMGSSLNRENKTLFKNIYQIPPGHYLLASENKINIIKYWDFNFPEKDSIAPLSEQEYVTELRKKLEDAVRIRLRADVPVGCYLSGGLDSSATLGIAAQFSNKPIPTFTLSFDQSEYDEKMIAREMAEKSHATFYPISIRQADLAKYFTDAIWHGETFIFNGHGVAKFLLSKAVHDAGYKVVLTGEGADELFAGYPHFRIDQLFNDPATDILKKQELIDDIKRTNIISLGILFPTDNNKVIETVQRILGFTPSWLLVGLQSANRMTELVTDDFKTKLDKLDSFKFILNDLDVAGQLKNREPVNQSLYLWNKFRLPNYILTILGDRMEMAHSIEGRVPFLDHHVAEFMRDVPVNYKIHDRTEKYLLREAARPYLTDTVYEREKHPFLAPPASLATQEPLYELLQDTLRSPSLMALPFFDHNKVKRHLDKIPQMDKSERIAWDFIHMILLSACILHEKFNLSI